MGVNPKTFLVFFCGENGKLAFSLPNQLYQNGSQEKGGELAKEPIREIKGRSRSRILGGTQIAQQENTEDWGERGMGC